MFCLHFIIYKRGVVYHTAKRECIYGTGSLVLIERKIPKNQNVIFVVFLCFLNAAFWCCFGFTNQLIELSGFQKGIFCIARSNLYLIYVQKIQQIFPFMLFSECRSNKFKTFWWLPDRHFCLRRFEDKLGQLYGQSKE